MVSDSETKLATQQSIKAYVDTNGSPADGWRAATGTWTYASASTITVPSGAASLYQKGDRIKWTQTTVKYGVIVEVADTLLTIAVNDDYTVANAVITLNYYSHQLNPIGYPTTFSWTPANVTWGGTAPTTPTMLAKYSIIGNRCFFTLKQTNTGAGSSNVTFRVDVPVTTTFGTTSKFNEAFTAYLSTSADSGSSPTIVGVGITYSVGSGANVFVSFSSISAYHIWMNGSVLF